MNADPRWRDLPWGQAVLLLLFAVVLLIALVAG